MRLIKCKVTLFTSSNHHYRFFHDHLSASNNEIRLHVHYRISRIRYTCIISYILCFRNERRNLKKQTRDRCSINCKACRLAWSGNDSDRKRRKKIKELESLEWNYAINFAHLGHQRQSSGRFVRTISPLRLSFVAAFSSPLFLHRGVTYRRFDVSTLLARCPVAVQTSLRSISNLPSISKFPAELTEITDTRWYSAVTCEIIQCNMVIMDSER